MAVSVLTPLYSKSGMWNMGDPSMVPPPDHHDLSNMAYQYGNPSMESPSNMIPSYHLPEEHTGPNSPSSVNPSSPSMNNRTSTGPKGSKIKKSMSTPNVRGQATADAAALALSAEKRRNKLGYHRTAVACGHCRRRKIRCIPAPGDSQNRCSNCIRLKKECTFFPVDQQPQPEPRSGESKSRSGTGRVSESSSPSTSAGHIQDLPPTLPYPHLTMPPIQDLGGPHMKKQRTESFSPENKVVTSARGYEYNHGTTNWMAPDASPNSHSKPELPQSYWRVNPQDSPLTPAFSPYTPNLQMPPPQNWPTSQGEAMPRDDLSWSVPQRSISYSNLEGLQSHHQYAPYPHSQSQASPMSDAYSAKPRSMHSGMYPHPISTSGISHPPADSSPATTSEPPHTSHSAGPFPVSQQHPSWQQPYQYQKPVSSSGEPYGSWSNPHGGQPHMSEEGHPASTGYSYPEPPSASMYYPPPPSQQGR